MPLAPEALRWFVAELDAAGRARLEPYAARASLIQRLDEACGLLGWSFTLAPLGATALVGNLTLMGATRADVVNAGPLLAEEHAAEVTLARCAALFGLSLPYVAHDPSYWVEYDPEAHEPLYEPDPVSAAAPPLEFPSAERRTAAEAVAAPAALGRGPANAVAGSETADADAAPLGTGVAVVANSGHEVIERLVERLKGSGLGKEAARLVVRYNGYGRTAEESRELYGRLRALLLKSGAEAT